MDALEMPSVTPPWRRCAVWAMQHRQDFAAQQQRHVLARSVIRASHSTQSALNGRSYAQLRGAGQSYVYRGLAEMRVTEPLCARGITRAIAI